MRQTASNDEEPETVGEEVVLDPLIRSSWSMRRHAVCAGAKCRLSVSSNSQQLATPQNEFSVVFGFGQLGPISEVNFCPVGGGSASEISP